MRTLFALLLVPSVLICSCSKPAESTLVGKWQTPTGGTIEFRPAGQMTMSGPSGSVELNYQHLDGKTMEWRRSDGSGKPIQMKIVSCTKDELVLSSSKDQQTLRRIK